MQRHCEVLCRTRSLLAELAVVVAAALALALVLTLACALLPASAFAGPGDLDRSFGVDGRVMASLGHAPRDMLLLPGGKFLVAGGRPCHVAGCGFAIARFKANGQLDESFGSNGRVLTPIPGVVGISRLARQPDGKLVAVGDAAGQDAWAIARYNADGSLDQGFASGGVSVLQTGENSTSAADVIVTASGKLVVAGMLDGAFAVARYNPDGSLDGSFGDGGRVVTPVGSQDSFARALVELPDGKLLAAGGATPEGPGAQVHDALLRYNVDGSLDESFGTSGVSMGVSGYANVLVRQPDGKLITAGSSLTRYDADGSVDTSFDTDGASGLVQDIVVEPDGRLLVVGLWRTLRSSLWIVRRLDSNGATDPSFCLPRKVRKGEAYAGALRSDGRLLVAGEGTVPGSGYMIRRYLGDGSGACADQAAPLAKMRIPRQRLGRLLSGRLAVDVTVTKPGTATLRIEPTSRSAKSLRMRRGATLARGSHRFFRGGRGRVELTLSRAAKQRLRAATSVGLRVRLDVADRSGNSSSVARRLTLRR